MIMNQENEFEEFIDSVKSKLISINIDALIELYNNCDKSRILISSISEIPALSHLEISQYDMRSLSDNESLKLLLEKCSRPIQRKYKFSKNIHKHMIYIATEIKELISDTEGGTSLLSHPLTTYLNGHPKKIIDFALLLKEKTMLEAYNSIK